MPVDAKPLFRPDALRSFLKEYEWPSNTNEIKSIINQWAEILSSKNTGSLKETELLPDFLTDVFHRILDYKRPVDSPEDYTITRELHVKVDGKVADAAIGSFKPSGHKYEIAIEGKGPSDPLDRPYAGRKMSAVDQAYRYAINLPCDWIIVTSMKQTRLYFKGKDQYTYERFDTQKLAADDSLLKKFLYLLGAERVVPASGRNHLFDLMSSSDEVGKELTKDYYFRYAEMRQDAFEHLCRENPKVPQGELLSATQKLLDRILFCAFCEDRGLLPANTIKRTYEHRDLYEERPVWRNFRSLFRAIDQGNDGLKIPAYNGGLFSDDPLLDSLTLTNEICAHFRELGEYDYRPSTDVGVEDTAEGMLVDVDILGHIFEQSITDLERLRRQIEGEETPLD